MDSTIITILAAIAIMAFQVLNEKKKREQKAAMNRDSSTDNTGYGEPSRSSISDLFADILHEEHENRLDDDYNDPYSSIISQRVESPPMAAMPEVKFEPVVDNTPRDIYDSAEIADHDYDNESKFSSFPREFSKEALTLLNL